MVDNISAPVLAAAALDEMKIWLQIMWEHAKFIRGGLDPTPRNDELFRTSDRFVVELNSLLIAVNSASPGDVVTVNNLVDQTVRMVRALRNFKQRLHAFIAACQVVAELPADVLDHMRREADMFLSILQQIQGHAAASEQVLGIPDGQMPSSIIARKLIPGAGAQIIKVARDENLFHLHTQYEHGEVLNLIAYRPKIQDMLYDQTQQYVAKIKRLYTEAQKVPSTPSAYVEFNNKVRIIMVQWFNFLRSSHHEVVTCKVPSGQINAPALLLDHMSREVAYYLSVLDLVNQTLVRN